MSRTALATVQEKARKTHQPWVRRRAPENVLRLHRASKAAMVYSEIAKCHITHPLPVQLELAEEDLLSALKEIRSSSVVAPVSNSQGPRPALSSWSKQVFLGMSTCGFWFLMVVQALDYFQII